MRNELLLKCPCGHSILSVHVDEQKLLCLGMYNHNEMPFRNKLRRAWNYLWTGRLDINDYVLYPEQATELLNELKKHYER